MKIRNILHAGLSQKTPEKLIVKTELNGVFKELFFESIKNIWDHELKSLDFILVALSHYASALDCDLHIQGAVTRSQLENIEESWSACASLKIPAYGHRMPFRLCNPPAHRRSVALRFG